MKKCGCGLECGDKDRYCPQRGKELLIQAKTWADDITPDQDKAITAAFLVDKDTTCGKACARAVASAVDLVLAADVLPVCSTDEADRIIDELEACERGAGRDLNGQVGRLLKQLRGRLVLPSPASLDTAEADRIIGEIEDAAARDLGGKVGRLAKRLRSRLTLKPRRLTPLEALNLVNFCIGRVIGNMTCYEDTGHAIAAEVARLWGLEVPEERPARALSDEEADELLEFSTYRNAYDSFKRDGHAIYAEALRLKGMKVAAVPVAAKVPPTNAELDAAEAYKREKQRMPGDHLGPARARLKDSPAPVTSVELSEAIVAALSERWPNMQMEGWDDDEAGAIINRILAARSARDVADMRPPFEGPKHGFSVPDEANANVNGLTGEGAAP